MNKIEIEGDTVVGVTEDVEGILGWVRDPRPGSAVFVDDHPSPPDLLPLILLELKRMRAMLPFAGTDRFGDLNLASKLAKQAWEKDMKRLGHWDERYEQ